MVEAQLPSVSESGLSESRVVRDREDQRTREHLAWLACPVDSESLRETVREVLGQSCSRIRVGTLSAESVVGNFRIAKEIRSELPAHACGHLVPRYVELAI